MPDIFSRKKRSAVMSLIRGSGNKATELRLIQVFRAHGITGWRRGASLALTPRGNKSQGTSAKKLARKPSSFRSQASGFKAVRSSGRVKPDFVFPKLKTALFVDGCFWHGCPTHATWPATRATFWKAKIEGNKARDRRVNSALRKRGWKVVRIWQHELTRRNEPRLLRRLHQALSAQPHMSLNG